jgi:hypothetical protein
MTPDRLRSWLARNRVGAVLLQLRHDSLDTEGKVFQRWSLEALGDDPTQMVLDCCGDYADAIEESARVAIEYLNDDDEVIASTVHKARAASATGYDAANAGNISENTIVSQLLRHIEVQQRVLSGSNLGAFQSLERVLTLQTKLVEKQAQQIQQLADQVLAMRLEHGSGDDSAELAVSTPDTEEESRARARAMDRVGELLPVVANMAINYMQTRANGHAAAPGGPVHVESESVPS